MKKVSIVSLGCAKNLVHSENMMGILQKHGYELCDDYSEAEAIIINTCGFINSAKEESINTILEMANFKEDKCQVLIVMGCMVQKYPEELAEGLPEVDVFLGTGSYLDIADILDNYTKEQGQMVEIADTWEKESDEAQPRVITTPKSYAYLRISEGCDNNCTYCVIPQMTGPYRSRSIESIVTEAQDLAAQGISEIILVAQDTTYYGYDLYGEYRLPQLLKQLCQIDGIRWIRLMYCYEDRITDELIQTIREDDKICNYLDIPIQHASDNILKAMKRRSTNRSITDKIAKLREQIPDIHIRTTLITGFPGETEEDFDTLYDFVAEQRFARLGVFAYSQEEGTVAGQMPNQIDEEIKTERADSIMRLQMEISLEENRSKIDTVQEVIVDEIDEDGSYIGRTRYDAPEIDNAVIFTGKQEHKPGDMVMVHIDDAFDYDLAGTEV